MITLSIKYHNTSIAGLPVIDTTLDASSTNPIANSVVTTNINSILNQLPTTKTFTSQTIATSAWSSSFTYTSYPYQATISCSGVTSSYIPEVVFSPDDATSGNFAPVAESTSNGVIIYAVEVPSSTITIPLIRCDLLGG